MIGNGDLGEGMAEAEGLAADDLQAITKGQSFEIFTVEEGFVPDLLHAVGEGHLGQMLGIFKGVAFDDDRAVGDGVGCIFLAAGISDQAGAVVGEQISVHRLVDGVPLGHGDLGGGGAIAEG